MRPAFGALLAIDDALGAVVATSTQPALGAIRLAWWREALERLDGAPPPAEPHLQNAAATLLPRGVSGRALSQIEAGWAALLEEEVDPDAAASRGVALFAAGATLLGKDVPQLAEAGRLFALVEAAKHERLAWSAIPTIDVRYPSALRPLTGLARLAARDASRTEQIEPEGTPGRALALLAHHINGRIEFHPKRK